MNDQTTPQRPGGWEGAQWRGEQAAPAARPPAGAVERFLGGSLGLVLLRLLVISVAVGALLMWLDIRPGDIFYSIERMIHRIWRMGFAAVRDLLDYVIAGAILVVPVWFVIRLLKATR